MSKLAIILLLLGAWFSGLNQIARSNQLKQRAQIAYSEKQYAAASAAWLELLQTDPDPAVRLNLAHALRLQDQKIKAAREYQQVVRSGNPEQQSVAYLQLGNMLAQAQDFEQALSSYKAALKVDSKNNQARYNYELLKKYLDNKENQNEGESAEKEAEEKQETEQQQQAQPQPRGSRSGQDKQQQPGANGQQSPINQGTENGTELGQNRNREDSSENRNPDLPPQTGQKGALPGEETSKKRLEQIQMTEERARALLDAMRTAEQQYLQQLPRKQRSRPSPNKPDW